MKTNLIGRIGMLGVISAVIWGATPGCGPSAGGYCEKLCDCTGCSVSENAECVDSIEDVRAAADEKGCRDKFDAYLSCVDHELLCVQGAVDADGCEAEQTALFDCGVPLAADNVTACKMFVQAVNALDCIGDAKIDDSFCDAYADTSCQVADYFFCLIPTYVCKDGALDPDELQKQSDCTALAMCD